MGHRQVGKAQDFDSCIPPVRVRLSQPKNRKPRLSVFSFVPQGTTSFAAQMNDVALRANDVLRNGEACAK